MSPFTFSTSQIIKGSHLSEVTHGFQEYFASLTKENSPPSVPWMEKGQK